MTEENKQEKKQEEKQEEQKDFKIAEIWIRDGNLKLEASKEFWLDKVRSLGVLELCKDILKASQPPKENRIIKPSGFKSFVRNIKRRK